MTAYNLTLESGVKNSGSTFSRRYTLTVLSESKDGLVVNFKAVNITPSGYTRGGSEVRILQNTLVKFKEHEVNKNIAKLALKFDTQLHVVQSHDKGIPLIRQQLEEKSKEKVKAVVI